MNEFVIQNAGNFILWAFGCLGVLIGLLCRIVFDFATLKATIANALEDQKEHGTQIEAIKETQTSHDKRITRLEDKTGLPGADSWSQMRPAS